MTRSKPVTYTKPFGKGGHHTDKILVEAVDGMVIEHPSDSIRGADYGRKHHTGNPERLAREIGEDLTAAGWTVKDQP